jgi:hypothetical protein
MRGILVFLEFFQGKFLEIGMRKPKEDVRLQPAFAHTNIPV